MFESFEYEGIWWLPHSPDNILAGILKFTPEEGIFLKLIGGRFLQDLEKLQEPAKEKVVLGLASKGIPVTLENCREIQFNLGLSSGNPLYQSATMQAERVYLGEHFPSPEEIKFRKISVRYLYLDDWLDQRFIELHLDQNAQELHIKATSPSQEIQLYSSSELKLSIDTDIQTNLILYQPSEPKGVKITQLSWVKFESANPQNLEYFEEYISIIRNFLTLAVGMPVYPLSVKGETENDKKVDIFFALPRIPRQLPTFSPPKMLFNYSSISNRCQSVLANWLGKADLLQPVYPLFFGTLYNPELYIENKFLSFICAVEAFHTRSESFKKEYISNEEYKKIRDIITNAIPRETSSDLKERIKEMLRYGNEKSLRKKLKDILTANANITNKFIENNDQFIQKVVNTRNYLVHYDKELEPSSANRSELFLYTEKLRLLLEICLLRELGFTTNEIESLPSIKERINFLNDYEKGLSSSLS